MKYFSEDIVREIVKEAENIAFVRSCGVKTEPLDIEDYPSIEISDEHGRLIDASELEASDAIIVGEDAWNMVHNAPTIIDASKETD